MGKLAENTAQERLDHLQQYDGDQRAEVQHPESGKDSADRRQNRFGHLVSQLGHLQYQGMGTATHHRNNERENNPYQDGHIKEGENQVY